MPKVKTIMTEKLRSKKLKENIRCWFYSWSF